MHQLASILGILVGIAVIGYLALIALNSLQKGGVWRFLRFDGSINRHRSFWLPIYHYWYQINHQQIVAPAAYLEAPEVCMPVSAVFLIPSALTGLTTWQSAGPSEADPTQDPA
jgi:hypothetical protein